MLNIKNQTLFREACLIDGKWLPPVGNDVIEVSNPYDGSLLGKVPNFGEAETRKAITAADKAGLSWRSKTALERSTILMRWVDLIEQNKQDLATIMTLEQGKPIKEAVSEIEYANSFIKWFAEEARRAYGDIIPANKSGQHLLVLKQPIGVVAAITPWNFPAAMITRKVGPALAVGCSMVIKPDSSTPFSALALAVLAEEAGLPAGLLNIITGKAEAIALEMTSNEIVRKLSFTGSTRVGSMLMAQCAPTIKKISLELGGNAPFIIFDDANIDAAVTGAIASKFRNSGQTCVCANRILVQDSIYEEFTQKFSAELARLKVGNGLDPSVTQGPLISEKALQKVKKHVEDAKNNGGKIILGGKQHELGGLFFDPTIITEANESMLLAREETFGPVAALFRFENEEHAIKMANNTPYGLSAYFYSQQIDRIWRVAEKLESGMVGINVGILSTEVAPFGGIKQSGIGREGSKYGLDEYVELKYLCIGN